MLVFLGQKEQRDAYEVQEQRYLHLDCSSDGEMMIWSNSWDCFPQCRCSHFRSTWRSVRWRLGIATNHIMALGTAIAQRRQVEY